MTPLPSQTAPVSHVSASARCRWRPRAVPGFAACLGVLTPARGSKGAIQVASAGPGLLLELRGNRVKGGPLWAGDLPEEAVRGGRIVESETRLLP